MGNFENHIPDYVELCKKEIRLLESEDLDLLHDCNCKFCDLDEIPDEDWPRHEEIEKEIRERQLLINTLVRHAKLHGIEVEPVTVMRV